MSSTITGGKIIQHSRLPVAEAKRMAHSLALVQVVKYLVWRLQFDFFFKYYFLLFVLVYNLLDDVIRP